MSEALSLGAVFWQRKVHCINRSVQDLFLKSTAFDQMCLYTSPRSACTSASISRIAFDGSLLLYSVTIRRIMGTAYRNRPEACLIKCSVEELSGSHGFGSKLSISSDLSSSATLYALILS